MQKSIFALSLFLSVLLFSCQNNPSADVSAPPDSPDYRALASTNGKVGWIDQHGAYTQPPVFNTEPALYNEGLCAKAEVIQSLKADSTPKMLWGYVDENGKYAIVPAFERALQFQDGMAAVKLKGKWGFVNKEGKLAIPAKYNSVRPFSEGLAAVAEGRLFGFIDKNGQTVIEPKFQKAMTFVDGLCAVQYFEPGVGVGLYGNYGFIDKTGAFVVPPKFDLVNEYFNEDKTVAFQGNKFGFINKKGEYVIPPDFQIPEGMKFAPSSVGFKRGIAPVFGKDSTGQDKWGFIDASGKFVIAPQFDYVDIVGFETSGLFVAAKDNKIGFVNAKGEAEIPFQYKMAFGFQYGWAPAADGQGKFGFIDRKGNWAILPAFDSASPFFNIKEDVYLNKDLRR